MTTQVPRDRERLSVQVDKSQMQSLRARAVNGLSLSDVVRLAVAHYLSGSAATVPPPAQPLGESHAPGEVDTYLEPEPRQPAPVYESVKDLPRIQGWRWADVDDPAQLAVAKACWDLDFRDDPPSVFPYSSSKGEDPANAGGVEQLTVEQLWAWVARYFSAPVVEIPSIPSLP